MLSPYHPLQLVLGLIVWSVYFVVMYGGLSIVCAASPPDLERGPFTWINLVLLLVSLFTGLALLYEAYRCRRLSMQTSTASPDEIRKRCAGSGQLNEFRKFIAPLAAGINLVAGIATLAVGAPVAVLAPCI